MFAESGKHDIQVHTQLTLQAGFLTVMFTPLTTTMPRVLMTFSTSATVPLSLPLTT